MQTLVDFLLCFGIITLTLCTIIKLVQVNREIELAEYWMKREEDGI